MLLIVVRPRMWVTVYVGENGGRGAVKRGVAQSLHLPSCHTIADRAVMNRMHCFLPELHPLAGELGGSREEEML